MSGCVHKPRFGFHPTARRVESLPCPNGWCQR